jgi:hypothetical protein
MTSKFNRLKKIMYYVHEITKTNNSLLLYNKTLELLSIVGDKECNIIRSDNIFEKIIFCFLNKLNSNDDKQLAIKYLMSIFPNNEFLLEHKKVLDKS